MLAGIMQKSANPDERAVQMQARAKYHRFFEPALLDGPSGKSSIIAYTVLDIDGEEDNFQHKRDYKFALCLHDLHRDQEIARFEGAQTLLSEMPGSEDSGSAPFSDESDIMPD